MKLLKICNIKNIFETRTAGLLEIPFLGYHLISENDFSRKEVIKKCVKELRTYYPKTKAILVTKEKDASKLISIVKEIEFDGIQLHYDDSDTQAAALKGNFGQAFIVFQVITPKERSNQPSQGDYILLDKSYLGGTGNQITQSELREILNKYKDKKIILAGGISPSNLYQYFTLPIEGFDVQSAVKSGKALSYENTDYNKVISMANLLGYNLKTICGQVGFAVQDIKQENQDLFLDAYHLGIDFFHIDISDGFIGLASKISETKRFLETITTTNSHLRLQVHIFVSSGEKFEELFEQLTFSKKNNLDIFVHINRDNFKNFSTGFIKRPEVFFGVDVKDIIDETYPWEQFIKNRLIVCLQSKEHKDRVSNLNESLKLIQYYSKLSPIITVDRNVDLDVLMGIESLKFLNIACGSYLKEDIEERFKRLKEYLYGKS